MNIYEKCRNLPLPAVGCPDCAGLGVIVGRADVAVQSRSGGLDWYLLFGILGAALFGACPWFLGVLWLTGTIYCK